MEGGVLAQVVLPLSLALIMFGMGLSLERKDFVQTATTIKPFGLGLLLQLLMLPLLAVLLASLFSLSPELSVGFMIIALCPGGVTSNMFSFLARGNVALSISLTAVVSLITRSHKPAHIYSRGLYVIHSPLIPISSAQLEFWRGGRRG